MKRKILSLLLVFVLLCGMLPAALAEDTSLNVTVEKSKIKVGDTTTVSATGLPTDSNVNITYTADNSGVVSVSGNTVKGEKVGTATITATAEITTTIPDKEDGDSNDTSRAGEQVTKYSGTVHIEVEAASTEVTKVTLTAGKSTLTVGDTTTVTATLEPSGATSALTYTSNNDKVATVDAKGLVTAVAKGTATINVKTANNVEGECTITVNDPSVPDNLKVTKNPDKSTVTVSPGDSIKLSVDTNISGCSYKWTIDNSSTSQSDTSSYRFDTRSSDNGERYTIYCEVTPPTGKTQRVSWDVYVEDSYDADISVTIYDGDEEYVFGDSPSVKGKSVYDQLSSQLTSSKIGYRERDFDDLDFSLSTSSTSVGTVSPKKGSVDEFDEVSFSVKKTGTFTCDYTIKDGNKTVLSGIIEIIVKEGKGSSKGDISYTGTRGGTVYFDARDFEDYFEDEYPRGELEYVTFSRASNGTVYYDGKKISTSDEFYANPGKRDKDLDEVYYEPSSDTYTGTATVSFTAYGENSSGTSKSTSGVVSIVYSSANAKDISYQATNGSVRLNTDDFVSTYKKATGVTSSNPTMYIRFTKLPSKGNLYVGYTANGGGSKVSTSTYYSSKSSASSYIGDITYVPSAAGGTETVEYTAYSTDASSGLKYTGKIVFTANAAVSNRPVNIYYNCTGGSVKFASADFSGSSESMALIDYLTFGTPSNGALYTNYANGSGDKVSAGNLFAYYSLPSMGYQRIDAVTYVPPMGWSGTASVPFTAYLVGGGTITGTVSISVTATSSTSLRDVKTTDWYATYVTDLMAAGVLTGYEDNTFRSTNNVTYGEILKLVMLATGYSEQSKTGTHWASGYVERALSDGIISERVNPDAYADRAAVADIAAKAMKLAPVTGGTSPFTDSANGYARALYNAGIITGYEENGRTYYRGANRIERSHIAAIIWRIMNYDGKTVTPPTNPSQPTTPSRPDTEVPDWLRS